MQRMLGACRCGPCLPNDTLLVHEGLRRLLEAQDGIELAARCGDLDGLESPDVVVTDIRRPPTATDEGIRAAERLGTTHPELGMVVLSYYDSPDYALALLEGGSSRPAYFLKDRVTHPTNLLAAIREVAQGGSVIDPRVGGGGGGLLLLLLFIGLNLLGGGLSGTSTGPANSDGSANAYHGVQVAGSTVAQNCHTGADANARTDCRVVGVVNSVQDYWSTELPRRGVRYSPADTVFYSGVTQAGCGVAQAAEGPF
jgi:CheY-like chemotaxis protein